MDAASITQAQLDAFSVIERACSVFSLLGCVFIIGTFCASRAFHKPINRLVFYASFGNLLTNVATLMARSYVGDTSSAGCQFQAFLIQLFMPADAFWTLAMAVNVYLTFYFKFDAQRLRQMEIPYLLVCYGIPFVVALTFVFIDTADKGRMYGNATLWCWVSSSWDIFRIATFYGPVWIVIMVTFFIYFRAGREIYKKHKQLRDFSSHHEPEPMPPMDDPLCSSKTTEVFVTTEVFEKDGIDLTLLGRRKSQLADAPKPPNAAYSVTISASNRGPCRRSVIIPVQGVTILTPHRYQNSSAGANPLRRRAAYEANNAAWSYTKCAILFFTAMLVTWIPSSANRVFSVVHTDQVSMPLEYMSAFVLPLQGFWNALIYIVTSWNACKMLFTDVAIVERRPTVKELVGGGYHGNKKFQMMGHDSDKESSTSASGGAFDQSYESDSISELANSRSESIEKVARMV